MNFKDILAGWSPKHLSLPKKIGIAFFFISLFGTGIGGMLTYSKTSAKLLEEKMASGEAIVRSYGVITNQEFLQPDIELRNRNLQQSLISLWEVDKERMSRAFVYDEKGELIASAREEGARGIDREFLSSVRELRILKDNRDELTIISPVTMEDCKERDASRKCIKKGTLTLGYLAFVFNKAPMNKVVREMLFQFISVNGILLLLTLPLIVLTLILGLRVITRLGEASSAVAKGNFNQHIEGNYSPRTPIGRLVHAFNHMCSVIQVFFRFTNAALMDRIIKGQATDEGKMYELSIMFGDAVNYTKWSMKPTPPQIFHTLNRYYTLMGRLVVHRFNGIIDKFIGDGIMTHFGFLRPEDSLKKDYLRNAVRAAIYTQKTLGILAYAIEKYQGAKALQYRFGIASGKCLLGAIGAKGIMLDYSLIGTVVNLASRVEGLATPGGLVIDKFTLMDVGQRFLRVRSGGRRMLKGIVDNDGDPVPIQVYHVSGFANDEENETMRDYLLEKIFTDEVIYDLLLDVKEPTDEDREHFTELKSYIQIQLARHLPLPIEIREEKNPAKEMERFLGEINELHDKKYASLAEFLKDLKKANS